MSTKQLCDNIIRMPNDQIIGLAKNNFLPADVQMAIAKHWYKRAHHYLAENIGLDEKVRDYLWSDKCNKGYVLKTTMLMCGHYRANPEKYWELYENYPSAWSRSGWRMSQAFFGHSWYTSRYGQAASATPSDLLNKIFDERYSKSKVGTQNPASYYYGQNPKYQLERLATHDNVDLKLAIKLSQCGYENVQKLGFKKIVELS